MNLPGCILKEHDMMNMTDTQQENIMSTTAQAANNKATRTELAVIALVSVALTALAFALIPVGLADIALQVS